MLNKLGIALGVLGALLASVVVVKFYFLSPRLRKALDVHALRTPEAIARGRATRSHAVSGC